jgi:hypothetical protein
MTVMSVVGWHGIGRGSPIGLMATAAARRRAVPACVSVVRGAAAN